MKKDLNFFACARSIQGSRVENTVFFAQKYRVHPINGATLSTEKQIFWKRLERF